MEGMMTFVQPFFDWLLEITLIGSVVICLILVIQKTLGGRLGPRWCHALWLVLLIRMILPWAPSSRISLFNLIPSWDRQIPQQQLSKTTRQQEVSQTSQIPDSSGAIPADRSESVVETQKQTTAKPGTLVDMQKETQQKLASLRRVLPILWLAGAIVVGAYILVSDFALWRIVKRDRPLVNQEMLELFEECKAQMNVQSLVVVVPSDQVRSPGLFGFIRPRLLLPQEMLDTATREEMRYVFLHELAHLKRSDIYLGWLTSLLQILHWFNPLVWFAFYRMRTDRELACDALVLTRTGQEKSLEYGGAIVGLIRRFSRSRRLPAMAGIIENRSQLKRRIAMIARFKKNSYQWSPLAIVLIIVLACISVPNARGTKASENTASDSAHKPTFRKIRIPTGISDSARLSPDGQKVILASDSELWIIPLSGKLGPEFPGAPVKLNTGDVEVDRQAGLAWSGDGKWITFNGKEVKKGYQRIYVVSADGGKPRQVHENNRDVRIVNYRISLSPHGKTLAFSSVDEGKLHIYTISIDGGKPKQLVDAQAREPVFSPDGKTIAYVEDKNLGRGGGGLWTVPADGGIPTLVADAGNASSPVWSPDGRMIAFLDYEKGRHIYIIPVGKGREHTGEMITVDAPEGIEEVRLLAGWPPDNKIGAITISQQEFALYTLPEKGGKATIIAHGGYPVQPRWSPDGKRIFHANKLDEWSGDWKRLAIASVSAEGGKVATVPLQSETKIRLWAYGAGNRISPDGNTIVFAGQKPQEGPHMMHIWTLPIDGGTPRQLTDAPSPFRDWYPCWSPDGRNIAFVRMEAPENWAVTGKGNIYIISAVGGEPRQVTSESDRVFDAGPVLWSPDGKLLAYFSRDKDDAAVGTLKVIPPGGGKPRIVAKVEKIFANKELAWSPDSKRIAFNGSDHKVIKVISINNGNLLDIKTGLTDPYIYHLDWSPDGNRFVFCGATGGNREFWVMENFLPKSTTGK